MKFLFLLCFFCCTVTAKAQWLENYDYVDNKAFQIPGTATYSTSSIAAYIQNNFQTDKEKIRAAYTWITANIHYSKDSMFYRYRGDDPERKLTSVLKNRKGVCEDYATLLVNILLKCGIPSFAVTGITRMANGVDKAGHSWCAVHAGKEWLLCDPTWDEGFTGSAKYFMISPEQFIETHFPFDPLWQLLEYPINYKEFQQGYAGKKAPVVFHYADSANAFLQLDTLQQQEAASARMKQAGLDNESMRTWFAYNQMKISIAYQENDRTVFNSAVADLNKAKKLYNDFVEYRNNMFIPLRPEATVNHAFHTIDSLIFSARKKAGYIGKKTENYQYDTDGLANSLEALSAKAQVQIIFLKDYFTAPAAERQKLFYH